MSILEEIHLLDLQIQFHQAEGLHSILPEEIELKLVKNEEMQDKHLKRIYKNPDWKLNMNTER